MNNNKLRVVLCSIGIILVSLVMIYSTYAYFTVDVEGEGKDIKISTFDQNTTIIYNDTSNVSMVNAYTGDEIVKTFSIENTSNYILYYDILLKNVVNNFEEKEDLVYTLDSNNAAYREISIIPSSDEEIASDIMIMPHVKHEYTMTITFLKKESNQSNNMNKTFSSNIAVVGSKNINIGESVYQEGTLLKEIINKSKIEESGVFYTNSSNNGKPIYYFKGKNINNNLVYNNMCFKIIRTDENYGVRLIYDGEYNDGICSTNNIILKTSYNQKGNYNAYVGYMFGSASSNNYKNEHANINNSNIKNELDKWYKDNFFDDIYISTNSIYCNNRKTSSFTLNGVLYSKNGYGNSNTGYYNINDHITSFACENVDDRFSLSSEISNKKLEYPVGLISLDEILYSGENSYLYNGVYWTITPAYFNGSDAYIYSVNNNKITTSKVTSEIGVRPVISLRRDVLLEGGDGSVDSPYIVK